jgi:broad specificity phosphatase PhoE
MSEEVRIFLFRHGETDWNAEGRFQGHLDIPLNETGRAQARELGIKLRGVQLDVIFSSDLRRAVETAQIVCEQLGMDPSSVQQTPGIREAHLGAAQGLTLQEIQTKLGHEVLSRWRSNEATDADISYPGGESGVQVLERVTRSLQAIVDQNPRWKRIGVATHGGVIRRFLHRVLAESSSKPVPHIPIPNGVVYEVIRTASGWRVAAE